MKKTSDKIRAAIKSMGLNRNDVSVRQMANYTIHVNSVSAKAKAMNENIFNAVSGAYYSEAHHWLCVVVNNTWLMLDKKHGG
jgi:hypothetical protein